MMINIFFPPLAVAMLTGMGMDTALNCLFFLLAVIPSHVHGFYVSWVYFSRRRRVSHFLCHLLTMALPRHLSLHKLELTDLACSHLQVRKGKYPGGPKSMITSKDVVNGGLSDAEVARLYRHEKRTDKKVGVKSRSRSRSLSRGRTEQEMAQGPQSSRLRNRSEADGHISRQGSRLGRMRSQRSGVSPGKEREGNFERKRRWAQQVAQDGYGPVRVPGSSVAGSSTGPW